MTNPTTPTNSWEERCDAMLLSLNDEQDDEVYYETIKDFIRTLLHDRYQEARREAYMEGHEDAVMEAATEVVKAREEAKQAKAEAGRSEKQYGKEFVAKNNTNPHDKHTK